MRFPVVVIPSARTNSAPSEGRPRQTEYDYWKRIATIRLKRPCSTIRSSLSSTPALADFPPARRSHLQGGERLSDARPQPGSHERAHPLAREEAVLIWRRGASSLPNAHSRFGLRPSTPIRCNRPTRAASYFGSGGKPTLVIGGHFIGGHIVKDGDAFRFQGRWFSCRFAGALIAPHFVAICSQSDLSATTWPAW